MYILDAAHLINLGRKKILEIFFGWKKTPPLDYLRYLGMPALNQLRLKATRALVSRSPTYACLSSSTSSLSNPILRRPQLPTVTSSPAPPTSFPTASPGVKHPTTAKMSTMPASHGHNEACCNIPPVVSKGYDAKGSYEEVDGLKTCRKPLLISYPQVRFISSFSDIQKKKKTSPAPPMPRKESCLSLTFLDISTRPSREPTS